GGPGGGGGGAAAAPAGPAPTMITDRRSTSALCSAGRRRLPPRSQRGRARPRRRSASEPARRSPWPHPSRASPVSRRARLAGPWTSATPDPVQAEPTAVRAPSDEAIRLRAGLLSLVVAIALLAVQCLAYRLTRSDPLPSDT